MSKDIELKNGEHDSRHCAGCLLGENNSLRFLLDVKTKELAKRDERQRLVEAVVVEAKKWQGYNEGLAEAVDLLRAHDEKEADR